jgi:cytosine/uracil/thiamine/allantoin permease
MSVLIMTTLIHDCAFVLAFIVIFIVVHVVFKNIRQILLWSCKILVTTYIWGVFWVIVKINQLPEWQNQLSESVKHLVNITRENFGHINMREL